MVDSNKLSKVSYKLRIKLKEWNTDNFFLFFFPFLFCFCFCFSLLLVGEKSAIVVRMSKYYTNNSTLAYNLNPLLFNHILIDLNQGR